MALVQCEYVSLLESKLLLYLDIILVCTADKLAINRRAHQFAEDRLAKKSASDCHQV